MFSYEYEVRDGVGTVVATGQVTLEQAAQLGDELGLHSSTMVVVVHPALERRRRTIDSRART